MKMRMSQDIVRGPPKVFKDVRRCLKMFGSVRKVFMNVREGSQDVRDVHECLRGVRDVREYSQMDVRSCRPRRVVP
jgi:hypothetical protein